MCLPPELLLSSIPGIGGKHVYAPNGQWAVDQREFVWAAQSQSPTKPPVPFSTLQPSTFCHSGASQGPRLSEEYATSHAKIKRTPTFSSRQTPSIGIASADGIQEKGVEQVGQKRPAASPAITLICNSPPELLQQPGCEAPSPTSVSRFKQQAQLSRQSSMTSCTASTVMQTKEDSQSAQIVDHPVGAPSLARSNKEEERPAIVHQKLASGMELKSLVDEKVEDLSTVAGKFTIGRSSWAERSPKAAQNKSKLSRTRSTTTSSPHPIANSKVVSNTDVNMSEKTLEDRPTAAKTSQESPWDEESMNNVVQKVQEKAEDAIVAGKFRSNSWNGSSERNYAQSQPKISKPGPATFESPAKQGFSKDASMFETLDDDEGSEPEAEAVPALSEKRRKRMLSNRASAQRSRQRRQERLDTLEVLVAELRVENAALARNMNKSNLTTMELQAENKSLRNHIQKHGIRSDTSTTESAEAGNGDRKVGAARLADLQRPGSARAQVVCGETSCRCPDNEVPQQEDNEVPQQQWNTFSNTGFTACPKEQAAAAASGLIKTPGDKFENQNLQIGSGMHDHFSLSQIAPYHSDHELDHFGIAFDLEEPMDDKKMLYTESAEDVWLDTLSDYLK